MPLRNLRHATRCPSWEGSAHDDVRVHRPCRGARLRAVPAHLRPNERRTAGRSTRCNKAAARRKSQFWNNWSLTQGLAGRCFHRKAPVPARRGDPQAALEAILKLDPKAPPAMFVLVDFDALP